MTAQFTPPGGPQERASTYLQTLGNGVEVLNVLKEGPSTISQIAGLLNITRSSAYRLVATLSAHGLVRRLPDDTYGLGVELWRLGVASLGAMDRVRTVAEPELKRLAAASGESAHLAIYEEHNVIYVVTAEGSSPIRASVEVGRRAPAYCVATGKAILAKQDRAEWRAVVEAGLKPYTETTITDAQRLYAELEVIRSGSIAVNRGEWREGVGGCALSLAVSADGATVAVGLSGPTERVLQRLQELETDLRHTVATISDELVSPTGADQ